MPPPLFFTSPLTRIVDPDLEFVDPVLELPTNVIFCVF
jgi:hypothetical protein